MRVNQRGEPIEENTLFPYGHEYEKVSDADRNQAIDLLCQHLNVRLVRTNATKHGNTEIVLMPDN